MPAAVAAAGVPAADKSLTVGTVLDTGRTAGDGRTVTGAWPREDGATRRTVGLDGSPPYVSTRTSANEYHLL